MRESISRSMIFNHLEGKTTSIQRKLIEEWLKQPANKELFYQYLDEWESLHPQFLPKQEEALERYRNHLHNSESKQVSGRKAGNPRLFQTRKLWFLSGLAACLTLACGWAFRNALLFHTLESKNGKATEYTLEDGTHVVLSTNSSLKVPRFGFGSDDRQVELTGEAEFKVVHTRNDSRFRVNMGADYQIEVLGTEFIASSRSTRKQVYLSEGKVKLLLPKGRELFIKPGSLFTSRNEKYDITTPQNADTLSAWKKSQFYFNGTSLEEVARQLEERFGVKIKFIDSSLAQRRLGGIYTAYDPDQIFAAISEIYPIVVVKQENLIEVRNP